MPDIGLQLILHIHWNFLLHRGADHIGHEGLTTFNEMPDIGLQLILHIHWNFLLHRGADHIGSTGAANAAPPLAARFCRSLHRDGHGLGILWIARNIQQHKNRWLKLAMQHLALDRSHNVL